jgi:2-oxoglutarate dehydrogenase E1 component
VRVEQLYPLATNALRSAIAPFEEAEVFWVQEEPKNMGAWWYIFPRLIELLDHMPEYAGRPESASPATGFKEAHEIEQKLILDTAFAAPTA